MLRDRKYLLWLRDQPCVITGQHGTEFNAIDPAHIRSAAYAGTGIKPPDNHVLPVLHSIHLDMHQHGDMAVLKDSGDDRVLRHMAIAYAEKLYAQYKQEEWV